MEWWIILLQIIAGLVFIYVVYILSLVAMRADKLFIDEKLDINQKRKTVIIDGILEPTETLSFNTITPLASKYMPINPSVNIKGGSQFTYQFWMQIKDKSAVAGKVLFMKGDPNIYKMETIEYMPNMDPTKPAREKSRKLENDIAVACPIFIFGPNPDEYFVGFNTFNNMWEVMGVRQYKFDDNTLRQNLVTMFSGQWFMVTIVFEDNYPINDFENGLSVKFYLNDVLYYSATYPSALKQNKGDLILFPKIGTMESISGVRISNFMYYNYAISEKDITMEYGRGPSMNPASISANIYTPTPMSVYNMTDMYNY